MTRIQAAIEEETAKKMIKKADMLPDLIHEYSTEGKLRRDRLFNLLKRKPKTKE